MSSVGRQQIAAHSSTQYISLRTHNTVTLSWDIMISRDVVIQHVTLNFLLCLLMGHAMRQIENEMERNGSKTSLPIKSYFHTV